MKILLTGGGTLGSVTPLLAVAPQLKKDGHDLYFIGTRKGPEREVVEKADIPFYNMVAPKLQRYMTWKHLALPFVAVFSMLHACAILMTVRPDVIVSAGGYVSVPLVRIGKWFGIQSVIHQQDLEPGLANKLMAPAATWLSFAFEDGMSAFKKVAPRMSPDKMKWIGNPVRDLTPTTEVILLDASVPTVMVTGGGTGAQALNDLVTAVLCEHANVIHVTGKGKATAVIDYPRYHQYDFLNEEMKEALHKADVVVSRAGIGAITELAALGKASVIIPMPDTHQEENAAFLHERHAAIVLDQAELDRDRFTKIIVDLLQNETRRHDLEAAIATLTDRDANSSFVKLITSLKSVQ